jgi:hypothetical protein
MEGPKIEFRFEHSPPESSSQVLQIALTHAVGRVFGDMVYDPIDGMRVRRRKDGSEVSRPV